MNQSCKDYDDDIENLQGQITSNAQAIAELQKLIGDGNFVKSVVASADGIVVTMSNGTSTPITIKGQAGEAGKAGSVVTINATTGEIEIDGKGTGFFASKDAQGKYKAPFINAKGELILVNEKGEEVNTGIKKNTVVAVKNANGSYTLTVPGADGQLINIVLPTAASNISSLEITGNTVNISGVDYAQIQLNAVPFAFLKNPDDMSTGTAVPVGPQKRADWKGAKTLPAENTRMVTQIANKGLDLTVSPANLDLSNTVFTLVNDEGKVLSGLTFKATKEDGSSTTVPGGRAAKFKTYKLVANQTTIANDDFKEFDKQFGTVTGSTAGNIANILAFEAEGTFRTAYNVVMKEFATTATTAAFELSDGVTKKSLTPSANVIDQNVEYTFVGDKNTYDLYYTIDEAVKAEYGIVAGSTANSFKVTKNPDVMTAAEFTITVNAISTSGKVTVTPCEFQLSSKIDATVQYEAVKHTIVANASATPAATTDKNYFTVDLTQMKTALGDKFNTWKLKVDNMDVKFYKEAINDNNVVAGAAGVTVQGVTEVKDGNNNKVVAGKELANANFLKFVIDNTTHTGFELDTKYFAVVTFVQGTSELNKVVVPFEFNAPAVSTMFAPKASFVKDGVINAYLYRASGSPRVDLSKYFDKVNDDAVLALDKKLEISAVDGEKTADKIFTLDNTAANTELGSTAKGFGVYSMFITKYATAMVKGQPLNGYGLAATIHATLSDYNNWAYKNKADGVYSFQIRILSPLYEGTIVPAEGNTIVVKAAAETEITADKLLAKDYNNNTYVVLPNVVSTSGKAWTETRIKDVTASKKDGETEITSVEVTAAKKVGSKDVNGTIHIVAGEVSNTTETFINLQVEDQWGFVKTVKLPVTIKVGE